MDPNTVITLLSLNLIGIGGLLLLISRHTAEPAGLPGFASGALVFGTAYLSRLLMGFTSTDALGILSDAAMVLATLLFTGGLLQFSGRQPFRLRTLVLCIGGYGVVAAVAFSALHAVGRHAVLNLSLAAGYALMAAMSWSGSRREAPALCAPLRLLGVLTAVLSLATSMRALAVPFVGVAPLFVGPAAQAYYALSIGVTMLVGPTLLWLVFVRLNERLAELATHDPLTRLLNRNGLDAALKRHFAARPPAPLVLILVDLDHFKHINDTLGHVAGDAVLRTVAQTLQAQVRGGDFLARWGGEEFLVGCADADAAKAQGLAERLRRAIEDTRLTLPGAAPMSCTASVGVSPAFTEPAHWEAAARSADAALYEAKRGGRNRVVVAPSLP